MFHPYFDNWDELQLIRAVVEVEERVDIEFSVDYDQLPPGVADRARMHFETLDLAALYSDHASIELVQRKIDFQLTFENGGPNTLRSELLREYRSRCAPFPNAWQPALYKALAESDEFVNGGFAAIEE
jgi:hypothetical protein